MSGSKHLNILLACLFFLWLARPAAAFGAGEIPKLSNQAGRAFRHGDIEAIIEGMAKAAAAAGGKEMLKGFAKGLFSGNLDVDSIKKGGATFKAADVKQIYFGNWLRDFSQVVDIGGLSKLTLDSLILIVACLGFSEFMYSTREFNVTQERLGVYLPVEHIDNPKGYGGDEDPRTYDERLRPPVREEELEIDQNNGMKAYIASSGRGFDTSADCIRRNLQECIRLGRSAANGGSDEDKWEAYRLLGHCSHTIEDFPAHSDFVELCLLKMGHEVFCYVGDEVRIQAPNGDCVPPIITGTFGGTDLVHSLMSEANDKMSSATISDLSTKMSNAHEAEQNENLLEKVKMVLDKLPSKPDEDASNQNLDNLNQIKNDAIDLDPERIMPGEALTAIKQALAVHDNIMRQVEAILSKIPMVQDMIDELNDAITMLVMNTVEPYITPFISKVTSGLTEGTDTLLKQQDQEAVFNNPCDSDPTHSVLSKDHFSNLLNFPAGKVAVQTVHNTVSLVVQAWSDEDVDVDQTIDRILEALHHPFWATGRSEVQENMFRAVQEWYEGLDDPEGTIESLSKESVRAGRNKIADSDDYGVLGHEHGGGGEHSYESQQPQSSYGGYGGGDEYGSRQDYGQPQVESGLGGFGGSSFNYAETGEERPYHGEHGHGDSQYSGDGYNPGYGQNYGRQESYGAPDYPQPDQQSYGSYGAPDFPPPQHRDEYGYEQRRPEYGEAPQQHYSQGYGGGEDYGRRDDGGGDFGFSNLSMGGGGGGGGFFGGGSPPREHYEEEPVYERRSSQEDYGGGYY